MRLTEGYSVDKDENGKYIMCHACFSISYHPKDVREKFCNFCDRYHSKSVSMYQQLILLDGERRRDAAARMVTANWRIRKRLRRITAFAVSKGLIPFEESK